MTHRIKRKFYIAGPHWCTLYIDINEYSSTNVDQYIVDIAKQYLKSNPNFNNNLLQATREIGELHNSIYSVSIGTESDAEVIFYPIKITSI